METLVPPETVSPVAADELTRRLVAAIAMHTSSHRSDRLDAVAALGRHLHDTPAAQTAALAAGALPLLSAALLASNASLLHRVALATMLLLLHDNAVAQDAAGRAGVVPVLIWRLAFVNSTSSATILTLMVLHALVHRNVTPPAGALAGGALRPVLRVLRQHDATRCGCARVSRGETRVVFCGRVGSARRVHSAIGLRGVPNNGTQTPRSGSQNLVAVCSRMANMGFYELRLP